MSIVNGVQRHHVCLLVERPVINKPYKVTYLCSHCPTYFKEYYELAKKYLKIDLIERVVSGPVSFITLDLMMSEMATRCSYHLADFKRFVNTIMTTEGAMFKLTPDMYAELYMYYIAIGASDHRNNSTGVFDWTDESWNKVSIGCRNI